MIECPHRLAQCKSECRADLEYREVIAHQRSERLGWLVIGRMSLEHQSRNRLEAGAEALCFGWRVLEDLLLVEFHTRLDYERDDTLPGRLEPAAQEGRAVRRNARQCHLRSGDGELVQRLLGTAGDRHLGADDIHRRLAPGALPRLLGLRAELRCALGDELVGQSAWVVAAGHGAVEMDLAEPRSHILGDHDAGAFQGRFGWQRLPAVRSEMVAAEQYALARQPDLIRHTAYHVTKLC